MEINTRNCTQLESKIQMIVHRYIGSHLKESIQNSELKVARVSEFNDPFEFRHRYTGEFGPEQAEDHLREQMKDEAFLKKLTEIPFLKELPQNIVFDLIENAKAEIVPNIISKMPKLFAARIEQMQDFADNITRVICFSIPGKSSHEEILRWGHYTNRHAGARMWFNLSKQNAPLNVAYPVKYKNEPVSIKYSRSTDKAYVESRIRDTMITKSACWSYEGEVRSFIPKPHYHTRSQDGRDIDFIKINPDGIERIDFGIRYPESEIRDVIAITGKITSGKVRFYRASCSSSDYSIKYTEIS